MQYTYILDDSIKLSPTLILTADHSTLLFLPGVFYKIKNFFFLLWVNLYMIKDTYLHDPPPFNDPSFHDPSLFCSLKKLSPSLCFHPPPPLLISDKSLRRIIRIPQLAHSYVYGWDTVATCTILMIDKARLNATFINFKHKVNFNLQFSFKSLLTVEFSTPRQVYEIGQYKTRTADCGPRTADWV